jgi:hypothetical protein
MEETFEIKVGRKVSEELVTESEDEGSEISDLGGDIVDIDDDDHVDSLNYLIESFGSIASVKAVAYREFKVEFSNQNVQLIDDDDKYQFEYNDNDHPVLHDPAYFIPFANFLSKEQPDLIGVTIYTNLEGGGSLII